MNEERELKKISEGKFELNIYNKDAKQRIIKEYTKEELRKNYKDLDLQVKNLAAQKEKTVKDINKLDIEDTPQLREFAEKVEMAMKLQQFDKLVIQKKAAEKDLDMMKGWMKEISGKVPEVLR